MVEVLSISNTYSEMSRKRREYFQAGVALLWMVDPRERTVTVYTSPQGFEVHREGAVLQGGDVVSGFEVDTAALFAKLDQRAGQ